MVLDAPTIRLIMAKRGHVTRLRSLLTGILCCIGLLLWAAPSVADTVKIVVPFAAGGPVDQLARILASELGPKLDANVIVESTKLDVSTLKDLITKAKQQQLAYGSAGPGTTMNIAVEMLNSAAGIKINHVPYRGAAPAINDLLGGHVDTINADLPVLLPLVKAGSVKPLALFANERSPLLPDLPTTVEVGLPTVIMENWYGIFLPAGTPTQARDKLEKALFAVVNTPSIQERFAANGMHGTLGSKDFAVRLANEFAQWPDT